MRKTIAAVLAAGAAMAVLSSCTSLLGRASEAPPVSAQLQPVERAKPAPGGNVHKTHPQADARNFCARNGAAQKVIVSLRRQHAWMCKRHQTVFQTAITSGMSGRWTRTPTGDYMIQGRNRNTVLTLNTGATYRVKYWIPFDAPLFGFHDSSWQHFPYGSGKYKTHGSHGCVHMPLKAMRFLYHWSARPTHVHITKA